MAGGRSTTLEINRNVRRILVSGWIDLGRVSISTVNTSVYLRGVLQKLQGNDTNLNPSSLDLIYNKIQAIPGVHKVFFQLENWDRNSVTGAWEYKHTHNEGAHPDTKADQFSKGAYQIQTD